MKSLINRIAKGMVLNVDEREDHHLVTFIKKNNIDGFTVTKDYY